MLVLFRCYKFLTLVAENLLLKSCSISSSLNKLTPAVPTLRENFPCIIPALDSSSLEAADGVGGADMVRRLKG
jgi:hypothetical protein